MENAILEINAIFSHIQSTEKDELINLRTENRSLKRDIEKKLLEIKQLKSSKNELNSILEKAELNHSGTETAVQLVDNYRKDELSGEQSCSQTYLKTIKEICSNLINDYAQINNSAFSKIENEFKSLKLEVADLKMSFDKIGNSIILINTNVNNQFTSST